MKKPYFILAVVALLMVGLAYNSYRLSKENKVLGAQFEALKKDPQMFAKEEIKQLTDQLSKLVVLPTDEEPVVATVTDKEKLKDQPVFAKAENGDKIVIYAKAQKAYVYRPSLNVLVDVIPVNIGNTGATLEGVSKQNPLTLALINGTKSAGLAVELEKRIKDRNFEGVSVVVKATGRRNDYPRSLVVDLTGKYKTQVEQLARILDADVATESSETKPNANVMVIIGENFK